MDPKWTPNGTQLDPKWTPNGPQMDPKWTPNGTPKWTPNGPQMDPNWTPTGPPTGPQMDPKWTPNGPQMDPKWTPNGPQMDPQMDPKWTPNGPTCERTRSLAKSWAKRQNFAAVSASESRITRRWSAVIPRWSTRHVVHHILGEKVGVERKCAPSSAMFRLPWSHFRTLKRIQCGIKTRCHLPRRDEPQTEGLGDLWSRAESKNSPNFRL